MVAQPRLVWAIHCPSPRQTLNHWSAVVALVVAWVAAVVGGLLARGQLHCKVLE